LFRAPPAHDPPRTPPLTGKLVQPELLSVVVGSSVPQFLGAMIIGPLAAFCVMQFDKLTQERIKAGFEMLVENFSAGIIGAALAIVGYWVIGPVVTHLTDVAGHGVNWPVNNQRSGRAGLRWRRPSPCE
jgi:mannitol-specific phosphotransferase system IIBC component